MSIQSEIDFPDTLSGSAVNISNTPAGNISSTTVQAAINELDTEKQGIPALNDETGTTYTFTLADFQSNPVVASNASASTYTIPIAASVAIPVGYETEVINKGAGAVTVAKTGSDVIIGGNLLINQGSQLKIRKIAESAGVSTYIAWGGTAVVLEQTSVAIVATLVDDKVYDIAVPNYSGTIMALSLRNTSVSTAGTYTAKISGTDITGLAAVANSATRTLTAATAANTFNNGDVISYTPTGTTTVVDAFITLHYTRVY